MHFQRIVQQNTDNLVSIKQRFIVGKNLFLSQPRKSAERTITGAWREQEPSRWTHPLRLARKDLKLLLYKSFCVLLICVCFNSYLKKGKLWERHEKVTVYHSHQYVCVIFKLSRVAQIKYALLKNRLPGGNPINQLCGLGRCTSGASASFSCKWGESKLNLLHKIVTHPAKIWVLFLGEIAFHTL